MLEIKEKKECTGCSACYNICPVNSINMQEDIEGFLYPIVDKNKCIKCGLCLHICPCIGEKSNSNYTTPTLFASWSLDNQNRSESSSGGLFYEFAKYILAKGGVVVGAGFDKNLNVIHKIISKPENLIDLKGSKYVQSEIGNVFINIKENLDSNKQILFVGTPCQVAGLYAFLHNKNYENLYTIDIICHGVPSPKVYRKYIREISDDYKSKIVSINFRNKTNGWKKYSIKVDFENNKQLIQNPNKNIYIRGFLNNIYLRPSCYECKFSKIPRVADITLGDFWGINTLDLTLDDDRGTSELLINSIHGGELLEQIKENIFIKEMELDSGIRFNPCLVSSVSQPLKREKFFADLDKINMNNLSKRYFPKTKIVMKILRKLIKVIKIRRDNENKK